MWVFQDLVFVQFFYFDLLLPFWVFGVNHRWFIFVIAMSSPCSLPCSRWVSASLCEVSCPRMGSLYLAEEYSVDEASYRVVSVLLNWFLLSWAARVKVKNVPG